MISGTVTQEAEMANRIEEIARQDLPALFSMDESMVESRGKFGKTSRTKDFPKLAVGGGNVRIQMLLPTAADAAAGSRQALNLVSRVGFDEKNERRFLNAYAQSLQDLYNLRDSPYFDEAREALVGKSIAAELARAMVEDSAAAGGTDGLGDERAEADLRVAIYRTLLQVRHLSSRTYEGNPVHLSFALDVADKRHGTDLADYLKFPWSPALGTSWNSAVELAYCRPDMEAVGLRLFGAVGHGEQPGASGDQGNAPGKVGPLGWRTAVQFQQLGRWSREPGRIGFVATPGGEVVVLVAGAIRYAYRQSGWTLFPLDAIRKRVWNAYPARSGPKLPSDLKPYLLRTVLDASFHHHGALLGVVGPSKDLVSAFRNLVDRVEGENDTAKVGTWSFWPNGILRGIRFARIDEKYRLLHNSGIPLNLKELPRGLVLELLSMDGGMIVDRNGDILAAGAILPLDKSGNAGGRAAAAEKLGTFGAGFKVSQDGPITLYGPAPSPPGLAGPVSSEILTFG